MNAHQTNAAKRRLQFKVSKVTRYFNFRPKSITGLTVMAFFMVGAFYVVLVNVVADKGNDLRVMDVENRQLEAENQRLEVEAARLKSLKVINESATGEVEVGDGTSGANQSTQPTTTVPQANPSVQGEQSITMIGDDGAQIVVAVTPATPKLVPSAKLNYLHSYAR